MNGFLKAFSNKKILVTGGTGSIGSEIVRQLLKYKPKQIRIFSRDETRQFELQHELITSGYYRKVLRFLIGDVRDKDRLERAFKDIDIVFHAAAMKHVGACEVNPFEAIKTNINGTQNIIDMCISHRVERMVAISSDKAVEPNTFMGITKLAMERMVVAAANYSGAPEIKFGVVRFGNVLNSRGSVLPLWINQIQSGRSLTVTDKKMERFFMTIPDAVNLVFSAATLMKGNEIFVLKMPKYNIYDLAQAVITKYGNGKKVKINITGARHREKMDEKLYTPDESKIMIDNGQFYIIQQDEQIYKRRLGKYKMSKNTKVVGIEQLLDS